MMQAQSHSQASYFQNWLQQGLKYGMAQRNDSQAMSMDIPNWALLKLPHK